MDGHHQRPATWEYKDQMMGFAAFFTEVTIGLNSQTVQIDERTS